VKTFVLLAILTLVAATTCIQIEVFNHQMGGYLPCKERSAWRTCGPKAMRESMIRSWQMEAELDNTTFVLTEEHERHIAEMQRKCVINSYFRDFVGTWGQLQYIIAPAALVASLTLVMRRRAGKGIRLAAGVAGAVAVICVVMMFYRGYFTAMGW
jgi:hypothetical protein